MNYEWDFEILVPYASAFLQGLYVTLLLSTIVILTGTGLGVIGGILLCTPIKLLSFCLQLIFDVIRALPPLVLLLLCYYFLPVALMWPRMQPWLIAWIALSVHMLAFVADVVRGAINRMPVELLESGVALGMNRRLLVTRVIMPEVARSTLPTFTLLAIAMLRNTSLASVIAVSELMHVASLVITNTFRALEAYCVIAIVYIVIVLPFAWIGRIVERRFDVRLKDGM